MNIFKYCQKEILEVIKKSSNEIGIKKSVDLIDVTIESPPEKFDCDLSTNIAMVLGKKNKASPLDLAKKIIGILKNRTKLFRKIELAGPGFINFWLSESLLINFINEANNLNERYGSSNNKKKFNIEFVSANPTGPMHVGHCRGAVFGDVLSNLLKFNGNSVVKEYYINDYGNQIENFTKSIFLRMREIKHGEKFIATKELYSGDYIIQIAKKILKTEKNIDIKEFKRVSKKVKEISLKISMQMIKDDLKMLGIYHDIFKSESEIVKKDLVKIAVENLKKSNFVMDGFLKKPKGEDIKNWKKQKRMIFKSTEFGDDADRALQKNDGSWTYFANDIAYHSDKISRNFDNLINILGADHTGYIKRITSAVQALSKKKTNLNCKVCQLVKLYKNGKPYKMSKRSGEFITVNELLNEVSKDAVRFMMLSRSNDVEIEFDFDKVIEKNKDNQIYYIQYCYARINSLFSSMKTDLNEKTSFKSKSLSLNSYEKKLIRKIFEWPKLIETASIKLEPHRITFYLYELATIFHSYWSIGNKKNEFKFIQNGKIKSETTLIVIKLVSIVVKNGMNILNVSLPNKM